MPARLGDRESEHRSGRRDIEPGSCLAEPIQRECAGVDFGGAELNETATLERILGGAL